MVTVVFLSYKRLANISTIISSIKSQTGVKEVILFNNDDTYNLKFRDITCINSSRNMGCFAKYAIALLASTEQVLIFDDDLMFEPNAIDNFIKWSKVYPESILGYLGMNLVDEKKPYSNGKRVHVKDIKKPTKVDIVLGRIHLFNVSKIPQMYELRSKIKNYLEKPYLTMEGEDILLSMANQKAGYNNYIIPAVNKGGYINLPDRNVALSKRGVHLINRDLAVKDIQK